MLYRNTGNPENPHGGTMWVISKALAVVSTLGFLKTDAQLDNLSGLGTRGSCSSSTFR